MDISFPFKVFKKRNDGFHTQDKFWRSSYVSDDFTGPTFMNFIISPWHSPWNHQSMTFTVDLGITLRWLSVLKRCEWIRHRKLVFLIRLQPIIRKYSLILRIKRVLVWKQISLYVSSVALFFFVGLHLKKQTNKLFSAKFSA